MRAGERLDLNRSGCKEKEPEGASSLSQILYISEEIICVTQGTATCFSHLENKKGKEELKQEFFSFQYDLHEAQQLFPKYTGVGIFHTSHCPANIACKLLCAL